MIFVRLIPTLAVTITLALEGGAVAAPTPGLTKPVRATAQAKALVQGHTTASRPGVLVVRLVTALRRSVIGRGEPLDPTVSWRWRDPPRPGATQVVAVLTVQGFADDAVHGHRWTVVLRRCDRWHLTGALKQDICSRDVSPNRATCV